MKIKSINDAYDYIYSFINLENTSEYKYKKRKEYSLENIKKILEFFDNPQNNKKIIHIAGTKGKGSVTMIISKLLIISGFSTCSFLSPHLIKPNERILYNLNSINDDDFIKYTAYIKKNIEKNNLKPTAFEFFFILFLIYAREKKVDYLIIEVGLGGRLDCTNIVNPIISVITQIGYDHTDILGKSISQIAFEKAGIIKNNIPVVISSQKLNAFKVINKTARNKNAILFRTKKYFKIINFTNINNGIVLNFKFKNNIINNFFINLLGKHQIYNFFTALMSVNFIFPGIINIIKNINCLNINIPGRIQIIDNKRPIILDTAHNLDSIKILNNALKLHYKNLKWTILTGMSIDKDYKKFYKQLFNIAEKIIITTTSFYKKSNPLQIYNWMKNKFKNTIFIPDFKNAYNEVINDNKPLLITGSFYIAGPFIELYNIKKIDH